MATTFQVPTNIRPFHVDIPDEELADLRRRMAATRWPSAELVTDSSQGVQSKMLQKLERYWEKKHDWRKVEKKLNGLPQFSTTIDGLEIHFNVTGGLTPESGRLSPTARLLFRGVGPV
jgi:hypothetical protein